MKKEIIFDLKEPREKFDKYLKIPFNNRIIFSAPFGSGKTYFLKEYFKDHPEYEVIHLYPVNYSVASNEDIFELIKYDIFFELLGKDIDFDKVNFSELDYLPLFLQANFGKVLDAFTPLLLSIPEIGKSIYKIKENLQKLLTQFKKEIEDIQIDDKKSILDYLESFTEKSGSLYEEDFYTQLICQFVNQLKQKDTTQTKETVLIIDDLDRVDPDHLFRILNVLSAQMDKNGTDNKFEFDKIILVFDQWNVQNIFENRYGANVDYSGYIDKFYSNKIFEFFNQKAIKEKVYKILNTINIKNEGFNLNDTNKYFESGIVYLFQKLIDSNTLTIRRLFKILNSDLSYKPVSINIDGVDKKISEKNLNILIVARLLLLIYGDWDELMQSMNKLIKNPDSLIIDLRFEIQEIIGNCIILLDAKQHKFVEGAYSYKNKGITYELCFDDRKAVYYVKNLKLNAEDEYDSIFTTMIRDTMKMIKEETSFK